MIDNDLTSLIRQAVAVLIRNWFSYISELVSASQLKNKWKRKGSWDCDKLF